MELNQFPLTNYIMQTSDPDITWLLPGISLVGTQDKSSLGPQGKASQGKFVLGGMEHYPLVTYAATPAH